MNRIMHTVQTVILILVHVALAGEVAGQAVECATTSTTTSDAACSGCPCKGNCDVAAIRDQYDPDQLGEQVQMRVRVKINYFQEGLAADIAAQREKIVEHLGVRRILLDVTVQRFNHPAYAEINSQAELDEMRDAYAESPTTTLNVFVAYYNRDYFDYDGIAVFPWDNDALTSQGGILVQASAIGQNKTTLTHEIGHALGLWHTSHGTALGEMDGIHGTCTSGVCSCQCYEPADGSNCNARGDFCCDTPPTPGNFSCQNPGGEDGCSETNWGETDYQNFMGFAADGGGTPCRSQFTVQQSRRMHCWACDRLKGWIDSPDCNNNDMPDVCDLSRGTSLDCDGNGVPDECQSPTMPVKACCLHDAVGTCVETTECHCNELEGAFLHI